MRAVRKDEVPKLPIQLRFVCRCPLSLGDAVGELIDQSASLDRLILQATQFRGTVHGENLEVLRPSRLRVQEPTERKQGQRSSLFCGCDGSQRRWKLPPDFCSRRGSRGQNCYGRSKVARWRRGDRLCMRWGDGDLVAETSQELSFGAWVIPLVHEPAGTGSDWGRVCFVEEIQVVTHSCTRVDDVDV